jgi:hypothetical protein
MLKSRKVEEIGKNEKQDMYGSGGTDRGMADPSNQMQMNKEKARHHSPYRDGDQTETNPQQSTSLITLGEFSEEKKKKRKELRQPSLSLNKRRRRKRTLSKPPRKENTPQRMNQKDGCKSRCITEQLCRNRRRT